MNRVHATAVVSPGAVVDSSVTIEPYAVVGPSVHLEPGVCVGSHAVIEGKTTVGAGTQIGSHCVIGGAPQLRQPGAGCLEIGKHNTIREFASIHVGGGEGRTTVIGNNNMLMAYVHVGHDCVVGNGNEFANGVQLAGHVTVDDHVTIGGLAGLHQFVSVGTLAMVGGGAMVAQDVPPYCVASGNRARLYGANVEGLRRRALGSEAASEVARVVVAVMSSGTSSVAEEQLVAGSAGAAQVMLEFLRRSRRGLCRPARGGGNRVGRDDCCGDGDEDGEAHG